MLARLSRHSSRQLSGALCSCVPLTTHRRRRPETMDEGNPIKMKVTELKTELGKRGLSQTGLKFDLAQRLQAAMDVDEFGALPPLSVHSRWLAYLAPSPTGHDPAVPLDCSDAEVLGHPQKSPNTVVDPVELRDLTSNITQRTTTLRERKVDSDIGVGADEGATDNSVEDKEKQALHGSALDRKLYKDIADTDCGYTLVRDDNACSSYENREDKEGDTCVQKVPPFEPCNRTPLTERTEQHLQVDLEAHETVKSRVERALESITDAPLDVGKEDPAEVADAAPIGAIIGGKIDAACEERSDRPDEPIFSVGIGGMDDDEGSFNQHNGAKDAACAEVTGNCVEATGNKKNGVDIAGGVCGVDGVAHDSLVSKEVGSTNGPSQALVELTVEQLCRIKLTKRKARFAAPPSPTAASGDSGKFTASNVAAKMAKRTQRFGQVAGVSAVATQSTTDAVTGDPPGSYFPPRESPKRDDRREQVGVAAGRHQFDPLPPRPKRARISAASSKVTGSPARRSGISAAGSTGREEGAGAITEIASVGTPFDAAAEKAKQRKVRFSTVVAYRKDTGREASAVRGGRFPPPPPRASPVTSSRKLSASTSSKRKDAAGSSSFQRFGVISVPSPILGRGSWVYSNERSEAEKKAAEQALKMEQRRRRFVEGIWKRAKQ